MPIEWLALALALFAVVLGLVGFAVVYGYLRREREASEEWGGFVASMFVALAAPPAWPARPRRKR